MVAHFYLMFARPDGNGRTRIHAKYWRRLSVNRGLLTRKVGDLQQDIARPYECQACAIGLAFLAFGYYFAAQSSETGIQRRQCLKHLHSGAPLISPPSATTAPARTAGSFIHFQSRLNTLVSGPS